MLKFGYVFIIKLLCDLFVVSPHQSSMNVCLRRSAVWLDVFWYFRFWHLGQFFRVGVPTFWEGLSGIIVFCPSFQHCWNCVFVFVCVFNLFAGCRKNPQLMVLSLLHLRANVFALDGMAIRLSVGDL